MLNNDSEKRMATKALRHQEEICKQAPGFTLLEVIIAIALLFMVVAAVFYFYGNLMANQGKIKEKYKLLRISRAFVDSFVFRGQASIPGQQKGRLEKEGFILLWNIFPVENKREVLFSSGVVPMAQLNRVHLEILKKENRSRVMELNFLVNVFSKPGLR
jgi:type II secretory pathway pseudopilin PulG